MPASATLPPGPAVPIPGRAGPDPRWLAVGLAVVVLVGVLWPSFGSMLAQWQSSSTFNYGFLVAPVSLFLLWRDRARLATLVLQPAVVPVVLAVPVAIVWLIALALRVEVVHHAAAVALLILLVWSLAGNAAVRAMAFPLGYLFLMVPFGEFLVPYLMRLTADFAVVAVEASGVPVFQDGYLFSLPSGDFEVIKACSGIRFLMATIAAGAVFAYVAYATLAKRLAFIALCIVVPVAANLVRAYGVVMAVHLSDMRFAAGGDHIVYGTVFYAGVLLAFFVVAARFADAAPDPASAAMASTNSGRGPGSWTALWPGAACLALVAAVTAVPAIVQGGRGSAEAPLAGMPGRVAGWQEEVVAEPDWTPRFPGARAVESARFVAPGETVDVVVAGFAPLGAKADLTSSVNRLYDDRRWRPIRDRTVAGPPDGPRRELLLRAVGGERGRVVWWWYRVGATRTVGARSAEWLTLAAFARGELPDREVLVASAPYDGDPAAATAALQAFSAALADVPGWH